MGGWRRRLSRRDMLVAGKAVAGAIAGASLGMSVAGPAGAIAFGAIGAIAGMAEAVGSASPEDDDGDRANDQDDAHNGDG